MTHQSIITPDLGEKVLKTLGSYARLPSYGIVAGQAVASAIDEILGKGKPVYNDIDVFVDCERWAKVWPKDFEQYEALKVENPYGYEVAVRDHKRFANRVQYAEMPELYSDGYECKLSVAQRDLYSIGQTRNQGVLNFVRIDWSDSVREQEGRLADAPWELSRQRMNWLTKVFDMNATQAAVDLGTGQLHVTPQFEAYVRSRQLQIVTGFTPVHSILRYLKKLEELGVYGDTNMHMRMVRALVERAQGDAAITQVRRRTFRQGCIGVTDTEVREEYRRQKSSDDSHMGIHGGWTRVGSGSRGEPLSFGLKYYEQYVKYQKLLNPFFMLTRHPRRNLWLLTSKSGQDVQDTFRHDAPMVVALNFAGRSRQPSKLERAQQTGMEELITALMVTKLVENYHDRTYLGRALRMACVNGGDGYCAGMEDANLRKVWLDVVPEHDEFFWPIVALPFMKQIALIRKMRATFKKLGIGQPWGTLARYNSGYASRLLEDDEVWQDFLTQHTGTLEPLCTPLPLPAEMQGVGIRELITSRAMIDEGLSQHHCVGGYSQWVKQGDTRIIAFGTSSASKDRSTAEWRIVVRHAEAEPGTLAPVSEIRFELGQHRAAFNKSPDQLLADVESRLRAQLNQWAREHLDEAIACTGAASKEARVPHVYDEDDGDIPF